MSGIHLMMGLIAVVVILVVVFLVFNSRNTEE